MDRKRYAGFTLNLNLFDVEARWSVRLNLSAVAYSRPTPRYWLMYGSIQSFVQVHRLLRILHMQSLFIDHFKSLDHSTKECY